MRHECENVEMKHFAVSEKNNPFCLEDVETMCFEIFSEFPSHSFLFLFFPSLPPAPRLKLLAQITLNLQGISSSKIFDFWCTCGYLKKIKQPMVPVRMSSGCCCDMDEGERAAGYLWDGLSVDPGHGQQVVLPLKPLLQPLHQDIFSPALWGEWQIHVSLLSTSSAVQVSSRPGGEDDSLNDLKQGAPQECREGVAVSEIIAWYHWEVLQEQQLQQVYWCNAFTHWVRLDVCRR